MDRRIEIAVVAVEQRAVGDRAGEVGGKAAPRRINVVDAENVTGVVEADFIVDQKIVALARRDHVIVAIGPDFYRAVMLLGGDRGKCRELVALRFLAAEAAAHAADFDRHRMARHAERMAHHMLHFARMLRRGIDGDVLVLARHGHGDLAFEIEMILPADAHLPLQPARRLGNSFRRIAALQRQRRRDEPVRLRIEFADVDDEGHFLVFDLRKLAGAPRLLPRLGDDAEDRLAMELHHAVGQHRLVMAAGRRNVVLARHVPGRQHVDHAGCRAHRRQVDLHDRAMRDGREPKAAMQSAGGLRHVVDIDRLARDVLVRGIVALLGGDAAGDLFGPEVYGLMLGHRLPLTPPRTSKPATALSCRSSRRKTAAAGSLPQAPGIRRRRACRSAA